MPNYILIVTVIILLCLFLNRLSSRLGIPVLLAFILLGMLFGTDGLLKISFDNYRIAEEICTVSLIFIMFYGGFGTNWKQAKPVAGKAVLLSTLGVLLTAVATGLFCYGVLHFRFWESMLIGAVLSSTDAASVFSILRSKQLNLKDNTASMLEMESGSNDPCSYMLTVIILAVMKGGFTGGSLVRLVVLQLVFGVVVGVIVAAFGAWVLSQMKNTSDGVDTIFVFSMALLAYAGAAVLGGNGYLSTYLAGLILGNRPLHNKKSLVHFFDGLTGLMQMLIFFLLGLITVGCVLLISGYLVVSGIPAIREIGLWNFLFGKVWASTAAEPKFGILPFILTSVYGTAGAILRGVPVGFLTAVYLAKLAPPKVKSMMQSAVSLLAGIPSVVYGLVGMMVLVPGIRKVFHVPDGASLLAAIIVLAIMILPSIIKVTVTALEAVPAEYEDASLALGATPIETYFRVSVPAAKSGIAAAVVLGVGRAIGEAMAVMMVSGNATSRMPSLFESVRFLTTAVASEMSYASGLQRQALFSIALVLFLFIMLINAGLNLMLRGLTE